MHRQPSDTGRRRRLTLVLQPLRDDYTGTRQTVEFHHPDTHTNTHSHLRYKTH